MQLHPPSVSCSAQTFDATDRPPTGSYFFGFIIGSITSIVSTRNSIKNAFYKTMDDLHEFMEVGAEGLASTVGHERGHCLVACLHMVLNPQFCGH